MGEQLIVTIGAKDSASTAIKKVNNELKYLDKEYSLAKKSSKDFENSQEGLQTKLNYLNNKYDANKTKLEAYKNQMDKARESVSKKEEELEKLKNAEGDNAVAIEKTEKQLEKYKEQMDKASKNIRITELEMSNLTTEIDDTNQAIANFKTEKFKTDMEEIANKAEKSSEKLKNAGENITNIGGTITKFATGAIAGGVALGKMANDTENAFDKLQGQLGLTKEETEKLRVVALSVYENGFGESVEDCASSLVYLQQNLSSTKNWTDETKQSMLEQIMTMNSLFGTETSELTKTLAVMQNSGLIDDIQYGLDIITRGFQEGGDYSGELLDTLTEYSPQFVKLGLSADEALNYLITGAENGAFNLDKVGDAMKEFSVRAIDGSNTTIEGFQAIGMNADEMAKKFAAGGESAKGSFKEVVQAITAMEDPVQQSIVGVNLFGTMWEDLGPQVIASLGTVEGGLNDVEGATKRAGEGINNNFTQQFKSALREVKDDLLPLGVDIMELAKDSIPALKESVGNVTKALGNMDDKTKQTVIKVVLFSSVLGPATMGVGKLTSGIGSLVGGTGNAIKKFTEFATKTKTIEKISSVASTKGISKLGAAMTVLGPATLGASAAVAVVAGGILVAKTNADLMNKTILYTTDEMNGLERTLAKFNGVQVKSKDELVESGLVYKEFSQNISPEFQSKVEESTRKINEFNLKLNEINFDGVISEEESKVFEESVKNTCDSAITAIRTKQEETNKAMNDLFISDGVISESEQRVIELMNKTGDTQIAEVNQLKADILEIEQKALEDRRILNDGEIKLIQEKNSRIKQIELQALGSNQEEILYAQKEFGERIKGMSLQDATALVQEKAKIRDDERAKIVAGYDTLIQSWKDTLGEMEKGNIEYTAEDKAALEEQIVNAEGTRDEKLRINEDLYNSYLGIINERSPEVLQNINKFNGQMLTDDDLQSQGMLQKLQERYDGLENITETGNALILNKTTGCLESVSVVVDENTGEITGIWDSVRGEVGGYTKDIEDKVKEMGTQHNFTATDVVSALSDMENTTIDSAGNIVNANGDIVWALKDVKDTGNNTREGILDLNGTPIAIQTDTDGAITNLNEVRDSVDNIKPFKQVTISTIFEAAGNSIKGLFGFADGTNYAPSGPAFVAEEGQEMIISRGRAILTGNSGPQLFNFSGGEKVLTAAQTRDVLTSGSYYNADSMASRELVNTTTNNNYYSNGSLNNKLNKTMESILTVLSNIQPGLTVNLNSIKQTPYEAFKEAERFERDRALKFR